MPVALTDGGIRMHEVAQGIAQRELYGNVPEHLLLYLATAVVAVLVLYQLYRRYQLWRIGGPDRRMDNIGSRIKTVIVEVLGHVRQLREPYAGLMHFFIFWGLLILFVAGALLDFAQVLTGAHFVKGTAYLTITIILDIAGLFAVVGIIMALVRRYILRPDRLDNKPEDAVILILILVILITGYMLEGFRMASSVNPVDIWTGFEPGAILFMNWANGWPEGTRLMVHHVTWWVHGLLALFSVWYLVRTKLFHVISGIINQFSRSLSPKGALTPIDLEDENIEVFGVEKLQDFTWKQLFDCDACTRCGRCQDNCPAYLSQKALSPKKLIQDLKTHLLEKGPLLIAAKGREEAAASDEASQAILDKALIGDVVTEEEIWDCTTCRSCQEQCPMFVEHIDKTVGMRRNLVLAESRFPSEAQLAFRNMENNFNPWGVGWANRADWIEGLEISTMAELEEEVEVLFWPGCSGAFDDRNRKVAVAMAKLLKLAGVKFGILGTEEKCCGDSARRLGNEYLFQTLAQENIETMQQYKFKRIVTTCPHCFNTLKNEYPQFGGQFEVVHHTEFLLELLQQGRLKPVNTLDRTITYHDSCFLGRYNDIYKQPRQIIGLVPGLRMAEMDRNHQKAFCCGAGGGRMWLEENVGQRINVMRTEQALAKNPQFIGTACPFCLTMLSDGLKDKGIEEGVTALDLAEVLHQSVGG